MAPPCSLAHGCDMLVGDDSAEHLLLGSAIISRLLDAPRKRRRRRRRRGDGDEDDTEGEEAFTFTSWEEAFAAATPTLAMKRLNNATEVPALELWRDRAHLRQSLPNVMAHLSARPTVQMASVVQPYGSLAELTWERPWREVNASADEIFGGRASSGAATRASNSLGHVDDKSGWLYFFSAVDRLPPAMRSELGSLLPQLSTPFLPMVETNLWAAVPGVSSPLHYDAAHNVYCQLAGRKRVILLPPEEAPALYSYPRLHPSTRQSQLDLRRVPSGRSGRFRRFHARFASHLARIAPAETVPGTEAGPAAGDSLREDGEAIAGDDGPAPYHLGGGRAPRIFEAVLSPGDRLYIPPYWWHRVSVVGDESALSIASYSQSTPMRVYEILKGHPMPPALVTLRTLVGGSCLSYGRCLVTLRAYLLALAALPPPHVGEARVHDASFACAALARCTCFSTPDAFELAYGAMADQAGAWHGSDKLGRPERFERPEASERSERPERSERSERPEGPERPERSERPGPGAELLRELVSTRYAHLAEDGEVATGFGPMLQDARRRMLERLAEPPASLPPKTFASLRRHAWSLRTRALALPLAGEAGSLSPAVWRVELASLVEDTASFVVGAREAEAMLRWSAGMPLAPPRGISS